MCVLRSVHHKGFSRSPQKLRGMGYNSDSTSFQDDLRPAMLNPSDMCEVTRGHGADLTEKKNDERDCEFSIIRFSF